MMTDDLPARVSPGEISVLLDQIRGITPATPLAEHITFFERKAWLLSRVASDLDTAEAHEVAADAWHYVGQLTRRREAGEASR